MAHVCTEYSIRGTLYKVMGIVDGSMDGFAKTGKNERKRVGSIESLIRRREEEEKSDAS